MKQYIGILLVLSLGHIIQAKKNSTEIAHPSVVCVLIVDQLAVYQLQQLKPYFTGGLKLLLDEGLRYENAHFNTAVPGTAPDHTTISTGAYASIHGVVANVLVNEQNQLVPVEQDNRYPIFGGPDQKITGASAHNIMVDTLSDQIMLDHDPSCEHQAVAISVKARASICCAGKNAPAFWFNGSNGLMTSSTAYFKKLPTWIDDFNKEYNPFNYDSITWVPFFKDSQAYNQHTIAQNSFKPAESIFNTTIIIKQNGKIIDAGLEKFERTPAMDDILFPFAERCFNHYKPTKKNDQLLFWFSISSLDKIGHLQGPWSTEAIDYLYHLDKKLLYFIHYVQKAVGKNNVLFVLTADHGTIQIPEQVNYNPLPLGHRIYMKTLIDHLNTFIQKKYGIENAIVAYQAPGFYINKALNGSQKDKICNDIKNYMISIPQVRHVWTARELHDTCDKNALPYKNQFYEGRSPDVICAPTAYTLLAKDRIGTDHASPYNYDTQVPLIFYWPGHLPAQRIYDAVSMTQLARTLSYILNVSAPSASVYPVLPGLLSHLEQKQKR